MSDTNETSTTPKKQKEPAPPDQGARPTSGKPREGWWARLKASDLQATLGRTFGLDLRSIAIFRIAIGLLYVSDVFHRALHLVAHYTDDGFMPRDKLLGGWSNPLFYSFHNWGGDITSQTVLFVLSGCFGIMLLIGFKTRVASIMSFLLVASVQGRNYLILQGGDDLLRVMMFWAMFLPLGARYSVDAALAQSRRSQGPERLFSVASVVIVLQLLAMYVVSAALKTGPTWHAQGSAIHLALHHHAFATPFGQWFRELPAPLLQYMTWSVYYLELAGPLLFFLPYRNDWARSLQPLLFISFHFGLFLTMELGHFPWVAMGVWLIVFPSWFWDTPVRALLVKLNLKRRLQSFFDATRQFIVDHRHWFRSRTARPLRVQPGLFGTVLASALAVYTAYGTAFAATHRGNVEGDQFNPMLMLRLYANWGMFAPNPPNSSGWFIIVGERKDGVQIDVWNDKNPVDWEMPEVPSSTYRSQRWRKFLDNIINPRHAVVRPFFLRWVCKDWNESHDDLDQVRAVTLYHMAHTVNWPEKTYTPIQKNNLQRQGCPAISRKSKSSSTTSKKNPTKPKPVNKPRPANKPARPARQ